MSVQHLPRPRRMTAERILAALRATRDEIRELQPREDQLDDVDRAGLEFLRARRDWLLARV